MCNRTSSRWLAIGLLPGCNNDGATTSAGGASDSQDSGADETSAGTTAPATSPPASAEGSATTTSSSASEDSGDGEPDPVYDVLRIWAAGCMADADPDGLLWLGRSGFGVAGIDRETFDVVHEWTTPTSYGISIDFYGYVWAVDQNGAHRVDPETGDVTSYNGLVGAYTYSDMTGYALTVVGGFPPSG